MKKIILSLSLLILAIGSMAATTFITDKTGFTIALDANKSTASELALNVSWFNATGVAMRDFNMCVVAPEGAKWVSDGDELFNMNSEECLKSLGVPSEHFLNTGAVVSPRTDLINKYGSQVLYVLVGHCNKHHMHMGEDGLIGTCKLDISALPDGNYKVYIPANDICATSITDDKPNSYVPNEEQAVFFAKHGAAIKAIPRDATGIEEIGNAKAVESVKYFNVAGVESDKPFDGVSIMVKTYTDGTRAASKVVK